MESNSWLLAKLLLDDDNFAKDFYSKKSIDEKYDLAKSRIKNYNKAEFINFLNNLQKISRELYGKLSLEDMEKVSGGLRRGVSKPLAALFLSTLLMSMNSGNALAQDHPFYTNISEVSETSKKQELLKKIKNGLEEYRKASETVKETEQKWSNNSKAETAESQPLSESSENEIFGLVSLFESNSDADQENAQLDALTELSQARDNSSKKKSDLERYVKEYIKSFDDLGIGEELNDDLNNVHDVINALEKFYGVGEDKIDLKTIHEQAVKQYLSSLFYDKFADILNAYFMEEAKSSVNTQTLEDKTVTDDSEKDKNSMSTPTLINTLKDLLGDNLFKSFQSNLKSFLSKIKELSNDELHSYASSQAKTFSQWVVDNIKLDSEGNNNFNLESLNNLDEYFKALLNNNGLKNIAEGSAFNEYKKNFIKLFNDSCLEAAKVSVILDNAPNFFDIQAKVLEKKMKEDERIEKVRKAIQELQREIDIRVQEDDEITQQLKNPKLSQISYENIGLSGDEIALTQSNQNDVYCECTHDREKGTSKFIFQSVKYLKALSTEGKEIALNAVAIGNLEINVDYRAHKIEIMLDGKDYNNGNNPRTIITNVIVECDSNLESNNSKKYILNTKNMDLSVGSSSLSTNYDGIIVGNSNYIIYKTTLQHIKYGEYHFSHHFSGGHMKTGVIDLMTEFTPKKLDKFSDIDKEFNDEVPSVLDAFQKQVLNGSSTAYERTSQLENGVSAYKFLDSTDNHAYHKTLFPEDWSLKDIYNAIEQCINQKESDPKMDSECATYHLVTVNGKEIVMALATYAPPAPSNSILNSSYSYYNSNVASPILNSPSQDTPENINFTPIEDLKAASGINSTFKMSPVANNSTKTASDQKQELPESTYTVTEKQEPNKFHSNPDTSAFSPVDSTKGNNLSFESQETIYPKETSPISSMTPNSPSSFYLSSPMPTPFRDIELSKRPIVTAFPLNCLPSDLEDGKKHMLYSHTTSTGDTENIYIYKDLDGTIKVTEDVLPKNNLH